MSTPVKFIVGQENTTSDSVVEVQFPDSAPAKPGAYEFQLVVVDELGVASAPVSVRLILQGTATAVLRIANADGKPIDQTSFKLGSQIFLTAADSSTQNGAIKSYTWQLTARP
jgi:hypothetical protein